MKWQDLNKEMGIGVITLFAYIFLMTGVTETHTPDSVCNQLECDIYVNVSETIWRHCFDHPKDSQKIYIELDGGSKLIQTTIGEHPETLIYKKSRYGRTTWINLNNVENVIQTDPQVPVDWFVATVKRYADHKDEKGYWRYVKDGDCWNRWLNNKNKLLLHPTESQVVKWSFVVGDDIDIDPIAISWDYKYKNLSREIPDYEKSIVEVPSVYYDKNKTWSKAYNYTKSTLLGYKKEDYTETGILNRFGVKVGEEEHIGWYSVCGDYLVHRLVNPGDLNEKEFCRCRSYTIQKGVCEEIKII